MTRNDTLEQAENIINGERQGQYGSPENSFQTIAKFWTAYLGRDISATDVANMMILLKVARNASGVYKNDNYIDICGYAAIGNELASMPKDVVEIKTVDGETVYTIQED